MEDKKDNMHCMFFKILIFIYPLMYIWQGLDVTDVGYSLVAYQQIFNDPSSISGSFSIWLTNVIGGLWLKLFGRFGLIGVRVGGVLIVYLIVYLAYKLLVRYIKPQILLLYLFLSMVFAYRTVIIIHYNILSSLFYVLGIYLMYKGLTEKNNFLILFSGIVSGANIFIRFPNILEIFIILSIFYYGIRKHLSIKEQAKSFICFIVGYIGSVGTAIVSMKLLGHWDIFVSSIKKISDMGKDSSSSHGIINLLLRLKVDHINIFKFSFRLIMIMIIIIAVQFILNKLKVKSSLPSVIIVFFLLYVVKTYAWSMSYTNMLYMIIGINYILILYYLIRNWKDVEYSLLIFLSIFYFLAVPMGSDTGISNSNYSLWLIMPLAMEALRQISIKVSRKRASNLGDLRYIFSFLLIVLFVISFKQGYCNTYRDIDKRSSMRYGVDNKYLSCIYTNKNRAEDMSELLKELNKYVKKDDYLFAFESIPLVHYATETKPYMYNSWPSLYTREQFSYELKAAEKEHGEKPVVVKHKVNTRNSNWPVYDERFKAKHEEAMAKFLYKNNYKLVWNNRSFEIYVSKP